MMKHFFSFFLLSLASLLSMVVAQSNKCDDSTAILVRCLPDYKLKVTNNCNAFCVPTNSKDECDSDADCTIYCFTDPCPQAKCNGNKCMESNSNAGNGAPCGDTHCGANSYCCNESCGICAPEGGACATMFCGDVVGV